MIELLMKVSWREFFAGLYLLVSVFYCAYFYRAGISDGRSQVVHRSDIKRLHWTAWALFLLVWPAISFPFMLYGDERWRIAIPIALTLMGYATVAFILRRLRGHGVGNADAAVLALPILPLGANPFTPVTLFLAYTSAMTLYALRRTQSQSSKDKNGIVPIPAVAIVGAVTIITQIIFAASLFAGILPDKYGMFGLQWWA